MAAGAAPQGLTGQQGGASRTSSPPRGMKGATRPGPQKSAPAKAGENQFAGDVPSPLSVSSALRALAPRTRPPWGCAPDRFGDPAPAKKLTRRKKIGRGPRGCLCASPKAPLALRSRNFQGRVPVPAYRPSRRTLTPTKVPKLTSAGMSGRPLAGPSDIDFGVIALTTGRQNKACIIRIIVLLCFLCY